MNFIEQLLGISPDSGSGLIEVSFFLSLAIVSAVVGLRFLRSLARRYL